MLTFRSVCLSVINHNRYDGIVGNSTTKKLFTAPISMAKDQTFTLKIAIQDVADAELDSAVYLVAQSVGVSAAPTAVPTSATPTLQVLALSRSVCNLFAFH